MFTGIVEEVGRVESIEPRAAGSRLRVGAPLAASDLRTGDSICVNGVCLTAVDAGARSFGSDVSPETLRRSSLGELKAGSPVNLERALRATSRLGGHIVQGHVDGVGLIESLDLLGDNNWWLRVRVPEELDRYLVYKGSLAIDGISLTVAEVARGIVSVTIIPHTYENTNLKGKRPGEKVNLETDVLAKYVEKMMQSIDTSRKPLTIDRLREEGW
jgi:riboflavin synthase